MPEDILFEEVRVSFPAADDPSPLITLRVTHPVLLHVAVGSRAHISQLEDEWTDAGVYVLLDRPAADGTWSCYVGKSAASGGVKGRLGAHVQDRSKATWYRAVAVRPDGTGWNEAQVAWLERHLYRFLSDSRSVELSNSKEPSSARLAQNYQVPLRPIAPALKGVLALIGHPVGDSSAALEPQPERLGTDTSGTRAQRQPDVTLGQMMEAGLVPAGTRIFSTSKKWPGEGRIRGDGRIEVAGGVFNAPSTAGSAITGTDVNGWIFWAVGSPTGDTLETLRDRFRRGETAG